MTLRARSERAIEAGIVEFSDSEGAMPAGEIPMIEALFEMHKRAQVEARRRYRANDLKGWAEASIFAYQCKELARELLSY